jgi:hypothetical protein
MHEVLAPLGPVLIPQPSVPVLGVQSLLFLYSIYPDLSLIGICRLPPKFILVYLFYSVLLTTCTNLSLVVAYDALLPYGLYSHSFGVNPKAELYVLAF